jgi:ATP-dependent DNA helicase RecG
LPEITDRRIGDFLKELHLTEGRGTGIPKIRSAMEKNGSPEPIFETDNDRNYFLIVLKINPKAQKIKERLENDKQVNKKIILNEKQFEILSFCTVPHSRKEIMSKIGLENTYYNFRRNVSQLIEEEFLTFTLPHAPNSKYQKYVTAEKGIELLSKRIESSY